MTFTRKATLASALLPALTAIAYPQPAVIEIRGAPISIKVLAQSPADTTTELQVICLFQSSAANTLHGSLTEIDEKLKGLLSRIRRPELFRGETGETILIASPKESIGAKNLLIVGLGDPQTFFPQRMQLVGAILYNEASHLGVMHPFFAPTIIDGGVKKFTTGEIAEQVIGGFLRAAATDKVLRDASAATGRRILALTYLAGVANLNSTREGIEKAIAAAARK
jgi:hypothetical protein